jgi:hypothetical protein
MSRRKKKRSSLLEKAQVRLAALRSLSPDLDLGNGLTVSAYASLISNTRQTLESYNTTLSLIDQLYNELIDLERSLGDMSERMLTGVASKYGRSSTEYEMAGGRRRPEYRRRRISTPLPEPSAG